MDDEMEPFAVKNADTPPAVLDRNSGLPPAVLRNTPCSFEQ